MCCFRHKRTASTRRHEQTIITDVRLHSLGLFESVQPRLTYHTMSSHAFLKFVQTPYFLKCLMWRQLV